MQDLCAPSEPGSRGQALAFWARVCPTNVPKLTALVMPQVKHAVWYVLTVGGPSPATAGAADSGSTECAGACLLTPGPLAAGELPPVLASAHYTVLPKQ